mmetsp:Transcript_24593/g.24188  ORF Transcript_24593/g.24188 Transcript_24593/m.24188 type:complete len:85 (+) Transcript_24593:278-532(+)
MTNVVYHELLLILLLLNLLPPVIGSYHSSRIHNDLFLLLRLVYLMEQCLLGFFILDLRVNQIVLESFQVALLELLMPLGGLPGG